MKRAKDIGRSLLGFVLIGVGICLIKTVPDPQGIMRALPFLLVGFGCGIMAWASCWRKKQRHPTRKWRAAWRSRRRMSAM